MTDKYLLENENEAERLAEKVDPAVWVSRYLPTNLSENGKFLDVGCGPGVIAFEAARRYPLAKMVGVDLEPNRFAAYATSAPANVRLQQGSALELPFPDSSFDYVQCRFLLEYLADRERAVSEMFRVLKPGGVCLLQDLDGQLLWHYPEDKVVNRILEAVLAGLAKTGFDPFVGRKLFTMARNSGFKQIEVKVDPYHLFPGAVDNRTYRLWEMKLTHALPAMAKALGGDEPAQQAKNHFLAYLRREDRFTYSTVITVKGTKPV